MVCSFGGVFMGTRALCGPVCFMRTTKSEIFFLPSEARLRKFWDFIFTKIDFPFTKIDILLTKTDCIHRIFISPTNILASIEKIRPGGGRFLQKYQKSSKLQRLSLNLIFDVLKILKNPTCGRKVNVLCRPKSDLVPISMRYGGGGCFMGSKFCTDHLELVRMMVDGVASMPPPP